MDIKHANDNTPTDIIHQTADEPETHLARWAMQINQSRKEKEGR